MVATREIEPLVVIVGETATGKSALAMKLARQFNGEIICADSWTVYEGFDIGTAKPSIQERQLVPHHLLDIVTPEEGFSAPLFQKLALKAIRSIYANRKIPILVGGTGLYIDSVLYGYSFTPANDGDRSRLQKLSLSELNDIAVQQHLPISLIDNRNKRRIIRLIENNGELPTKSSLRQNTIVIGLKASRDDLRERVEKRVHNMIRNGLENEVRILAEEHGWLVEPMKGIGYREWKDFFEGSKTVEDVEKRIISSTMKLAKKQRTWFKRNTDIDWFDYKCEMSMIDDKITTFMNNIF